MLNGKKWPVYGIFGKEAWELEFYLTSRDDAPKGITGQLNDLLLQANGFSLALDRSRRELFNI